MNSQRHVRTSLVYWAIAGSAISLAMLVAVGSHGSPAAEAQSAIHVTDIIGKLPIGLLGKPLGSKVVVEGMRAEQVLLENPLAITIVDGQPLKETVRLELPQYEQLKSKTRYVLEGYESGAFAGEPGWHNDKVQQSFQYRARFVVTATIEPKNPRP